jgi:hypothetical protein
MLRTLQRNRIARPLILAISLMSGEMDISEQFNREHKIRNDLTRTHIHRHHRRSEG